MSLCNTLKNRLFVDFYLKFSECLFSFSELLMRQFVRLHLKTCSPVLLQLVALSALSDDRLLRAKQHPADSASEVFKTPRLHGASCYQMSTVTAVTVDRYTCTVKLPDVLYVKNAFVNFVSRVTE